MSINMSDPTQIKSEGGWRVATYTRNHVQPPNKQLIEKRCFRPKFGHHLKPHGKNHLTEFNSIQFKQFEVVGGWGNLPFFRAY